MLRPCACIILSLSLSTPLLAFAAPESGKAEKAISAEHEKLQADLKNAAILEVQAYRLVSQFYLYGAQGKNASDIASLQKMAKTGGRLALRCDSKAQTAWEQLSDAVNNGALEADGKPSAETHQKIAKKLGALSDSVDNYISDIRKKAKMPPKGPADPLQDLAVKFENVIFNHLSGQDEAEHQRLFAQLNARFNSIAETYKINDGGKSVQEACSKWPVLREAILKSKERNPVFIISRFHDQIADDLNTALESQPRY